MRCELGVNGPPQRLAVGDPGGERRQTWRVQGHGLILRLLEDFHLETAWEWPVTSLFPTNKNMDRSGPPRPALPAEDSLSAVPPDVCPGRGPGRQVQARPGEGGPAGYLQIRPRSQ